MHHPCRNDDGELVVIHRPSAPTALAHWSEPAALATAVPACRMPDRLNGIVLSPSAVPAAAGISGEAVEEPAFILPPDMKAAAGAVVVESDGRVWLVAPTNGFGGFEPTFPKGRVDPGGTLQQTAVREVFEETGLVVRLEAFLIDVPRTQTYTRYYVATRIAGCPSRMGWETQAVHLAPAVRLEEVASKAHDAAIIHAAREWMAGRRIA